MCPLKVPLCLASFFDVVDILYRLYYSRSQGRSNPPTLQTEILSPRAIWKPEF